MERERRVEREGRIVGGRKKRHRMDRQTDERGGTDKQTD
jgi:hypothetical protein